MPGGSSTTTSLPRTLEEVIDAGAGIEPSFFEVAAAVAFLAFARTPADACILEVGLGGRLDATNVIERPLVTGIANLALDHQQFLGSGLPDIAGEKAAIAKRGVPLVTQLYPPAIASRIEEIARKRGAIWLPRGGDWDAIAQQGKLRYRDEEGELELPLPRLAGRHQAMNAALAVAMLRHQDAFHVPVVRFVRGHGMGGLAGAASTSGARPARREPRGVAGRRPQSFGGSADRRLRQASFDDGRPLHLIFASLATKDPAGMLEPFRGVAAHVHAVPIPDHACFAPSDLVEIAGGLGFPADAHDNVEEVLAIVPKNARVLIFGSLYLAGAVLAANDQLPD